MTLRKVLIDIVEFLAVVYGNAHVAYTNPSHISHNLDKSDAQQYLLRLPGPGVDNGPVLYGQGLPVGAFELEHACCKDDGKEYVEDVDRCH